MMMVRMKDEFDRMTAGDVFLCRYVSNGREYVARIRAHDASDAWRKMKEVPWAPGCGPLAWPVRMREAAHGGPTFKSRIAAIVTRVIANAEDGSRIAFLGGRR
jgi:hypothetical protein